MDRYFLRKVHQEIDQRGYSLYQMAEQFVDRHKLLTPNQANGLWNVVSGEKSIQTVMTKYIQHQAGKSTATDPAFWNDLKRELDSLRKQAEEVQQQLALTLEKGETQKGQRDEIHLLLARVYIQHLVAQTIYRRTQTGGR
jgi:hypothetical protein